MRGHTATNCKDTLSSLHTCNVFGRSLKTNKNNLLALCIPSFCVVSCEYNLTASSTGRCAKTLTDWSSSLNSSSIKLRVKKSIEVTRVDHSNSLSLCLMAFVYEVTSNLKSSLSCSLTVTALEHIELLVFNSELHILHIVVVIFKSITNLDKFSISFREFFFHLSDWHWCTNTCNYVLALCVDKKFTHQLVFACSRVTSECNTCT